jgi:branched-chain amino acid transport system permease protein
MALSLNLLYGYTGLLSLGQGIYFALGAYGAAWAALYNINFWGALGAGLLCACVGALLVGWVSVRASGYGFVVVTLVTALVCYLLALSADSITGGEDGMSFRSPALTVPGLAVSVQDLWVRYYLALGAFLVGLVVVSRVIKSPLGLAFRAVRDDEIAAAFVGYNIFAIKLFSFGRGGVLAGVGRGRLGHIERVCAGGALSVLRGVSFGSARSRSLDRRACGWGGQAPGPAGGTGILLGLRELFVGVWPQGYALAMGGALIFLALKRP